MNLADCLKLLRQGTQKEFHLPPETHDRLLRREELAYNRLKETGLSEEDARRQAGEAVVKPYLEDFSKQVSDNTAAIEALKAPKEVLPPAANVGDIDPEIAKVVSESAERIADQVTQGQPTAVREAARDAALNNAMGSLRAGKPHSVSFMRKSAQTAAGEALKKQGESLDAPIGEGEATKLDQEAAPTTVSNEELYKPLNDVLGSTLSERDAAIVRSVQEKSLDDVAKEHGLSKTRIHQIVQESLPRLRKALEEAGYTKDDYAGGPGAMGPVESLEAKLKSTGTKNEVMQAEREARGEDPLVKEEPVSNRQSIDEAVGVLLEDPARGEVLAQEINNSARDVRTISAADEAILMAHKVELRKQRADQEAIYSDGDKSPIEHAIAKQRLKEIEAKMNEVDQATFASGAEWGRMGQLRQRMLRDDYSIENMERKARIEKGDALTPEEKAKIKEHSDKIQSLETKLEEVQKSEANAVKAADEAVKELNARVDPSEKFAPRVLALAESIVTRLDKAADAARDRIRERLKNASAGLDPTVVYDVAVIGTSKLARASLDFAKWSAEMTADLGEWVKPYLADAWKESEKQWTAEEKKIGGAKQDVSKVRKTKADATSSATTVADTISSRAKEGDKPADVSGLVQKLALDFVRSGIKDREPLVTAVHDVLKQSFPDLTREQARDLISGYGEFKALDKDAAKVTLRGLKGEMQQIGKIQDMQAKQAPKKTGVERRAPTDEERKLIKEVNELKKKGGFEVVDPEKQLKTAMDAVKTRLTNEIRDLDTAIGTQERLPSKKNVLQYDAEAKALKERRDAKRAEYDELFPKEPLTDAQMIDRAGKALDRSITQLEGDLKSGKLYGEKNARSLTSPELEAKRARLEALRAQRDELRAMDTATLEQRALQQFKTRTANRIAELQEKIAQQDFSKKIRTEVKLDPEATKLKFEIEKVKEQYNKELVRIKNSQQSLFRRVLRGTAEVANLQRAIFTGFDLSAVLNQGGFIVTGSAFHPMSALRSLKGMVQAIKSESGKFEVMEGIRKRANYPLYEKSKLFLADSTKASLNKAEEAFMSRWLEKMELSTEAGLKGTAKRATQRTVNTLLAPVRASERAYTGFLNQLRAETFDRIAGGLESKNKVLGLDDFKAIANFVNQATGRGGFGKFENAGQALSTLYFSPRFVMSRLGLLTGEPIRNATPATRGAIAKEYGHYLGAVAAFYALGVAAGGKVESDPRSTDFGKLRLKNGVRIDPLVGIAQVTTFLSRMVTGETKKNGQIIPLRENARPLETLRKHGLMKERAGQPDRTNAGDVAGQFSRSKLAPVPGAVWSGLKGEDFMGKKTTFLKEFSKIAFPMSGQSVLDSMKNNGVPEGVALSILQILGARINQYQDRPQR